jgi:hypothetical protein
MRGQDKKYYQKFGWEQTVRRPPLGIEDKCECNIKVNDSAIVLEDWSWAEQAYDFIKLWTSGLVTLSLLWPLERISKRDNYSMKGEYNKFSTKRVKLLLYKSQYDSYRCNDSGGRWRNGLTPQHFAEA